MTTSSPATSPRDCPTACPNSSAALTATAGQAHHRRGARCRPRLLLGAAFRTSRAACSRRFRGTTTRCGTPPCSSEEATPGFTSICLNSRSRRSSQVSLDSGTGCRVTGRFNVAPGRENLRPRGAANTDRTLDSVAVIGDHRPARTPPR